jgi:hypothetical protein
MLLSVLLASVLVLATATCRSLKQIDVRHLPGRIFLIEEARAGSGGASKRIPERLEVMDATGTGRRVLTDAVEPFSAVWYPKLGVLGIVNSPLASGPTGKGFFTLHITGGRARDVSVESIEPSLPNDFRTHFYEPTVRCGGPRGDDCQSFPEPRNYSTRVTFSPDGKQVAGIAFFMNPTMKGGRGPMCVVAADGSAHEQCETSVEPCETQSPVWSPDGAHVVFQGSLPDNSYRCNLSELYIADSAMRNVSQLTNVEGPHFKKPDWILVKPGARTDHMHRSTEPQFSSDGQWIAFVAYGGIYRVHPDGSGLQLVIPDGDWPAWSPDSKMLMYVMHPNGLMSILSPEERFFVAYADGSSPTEVPVHPRTSPGQRFRDLNWAE